MNVVGVRCHPVGRDVSHGFKRVPLFINKDTTPTKRARVPEPLLLRGQPNILGHSSIRRDGYAPGFYLAYIFLSLRNTLRCFIWGHHTRPASSPLVGRRRGLLPYLGQSKLDPTKYRPIYILCAASKLFRSVLNILLTLSIKNILIS